MNNLRFCIPECAGKIPSCTEEADRKSNKFKLTTVQYCL